MAGFVRYLIATTVALFPMTLSPLSAQTERLSIEAIELRPILFETGQVGEPILITKESFNIMPGGGGNFADAYDLLVIVKMRDSLADTPFSEQPLLIEARDSEGKILAKRSLVPYNGALLSTITASVLLHDVHCQGEITIKATVGTSQQSLRLPLECGE